MPFDDDSFEATATKRELAGATAKATRSLLAAATAIGTVEAGPA